ncbi:hypothetical protein AV540_02440 [Brevibacillus parabrevis]|nr:hypothetical protein AV540_02440 [Brevibacillus parabrevis]HBZ82489.1 hypothetical protein [Brevibacillus sp.]
MHFCYLNLFSYQISVPVEPGNSSGAVVNEYGDLIGIVAHVFGNQKVPNFAAIIFYQYAARSDLYAGFDMEPLWVVTADKPIIHTAPCQIQLH